MCKSSSRSTLSAKVKALLELSPGLGHFHNYDDRHLEVDEDWEYFYMVRRCFTRKTSGPRTGLHFFMQNTVSKFSEVFHIMQSSRLARFAVLEWWLWKVKGSLNRYWEKGVHPRVVSVLEELLAQQVSRLLLSGEMHIDLGSNAINNGTALPGI